MPGISNKTRLPSVETCSVRQWQTGTVLVSQRWKYPMMITGTVNKWVFLKPCNTPSSTVGRYETFPDDVTTYTANVGGKE